MIGMFYVPFLVAMTSFMSSCSTNVQQRKSHRRYIFGGICKYLYSLEFTAYTSRRLLSYLARLAIDVRREIVVVLSIDNTGLKM